MMPSAVCGKTQDSGVRVAVVYRPTSTLQINARNARVHSKKQIDKIADSIAAFGFNVPVLVDRDLKVIAGHGRLLASCQLGYAEVLSLPRFGGRFFG